VYTSDLRTHNFPSVVYHLENFFFEVVQITVLHYLTFLDKGSESDRLKMGQLHHIPFSLQNMTSFIMI